jgi:AcrR family transcriptional regulator
MLTPILTSKDKIQRAALSLVANDGFAGATTARIAAEAGVAEGSIYRHFKSKDALMLAIYRRIKAEVYMAVMEEYDAAAPAHDRFTHIWRHIFAAYQADPDALLFGLRFTETPLMEMEGGQGHKEMAAVLTCLRDDGVATGVFKSIAADLLISLFYAPIVTLLRAEIAGRQWDEEEVSSACEASYDSWAVPIRPHNS